MGPMLLVLTLSVGTLGHAHFIDGLLRACTVLFDRRCRARPRPRHRNGVGRAAAESAGDRAVCATVQRRGRSVMMS